MARKHRRNPNPNSNPKPNSNPNPNPKNAPVRKGESVPSAEKRRQGPPPGRSVAPLQKAGPPQKGRPAPPQKQPQPKPAKETPQNLGERLIKSFPPEYSRIQEFLKSCRGVQTAFKNGLLSSPGPEELFYFIASCIETLTEDRIDHLFDSEYRARLKEIRLAAGLEENEFFSENDSRAPEEYHQLLDEFRLRKRAVIASAFKEHRQEEAARLIVENYGEYRERCSLGRRKYLEHNPVDPFISQVVSGELAEEA